MKAFGVQTLNFVRFEKAVSIAKLGLIREIILSSLVSSAICPSHGFAIFRRALTCSFSKPVTLQMVHPLYTL